MRLKQIEGCDINLDQDGVIRFTADADIDSDGGPNVDNDPCWQPETTLKFNGKSINAQKVPFAVIPIGILNKVGPIGLGCKVIVTDTRNGRWAFGVLADLGPTRKVGEISPEMARRIGINPNSVRGGEDEKVIRYEIFIGVPAVVDGITYKLQPLGK
jgi:hypothetical protein